MLVVLIRRHWICRETKFGVERHASFLACIACCFLWNYRFILESRATSSSCSFFMFHLGSGSTMVLKGSLWLKALVWYFNSIFRTEQSFVLYEGIFIGTGAGFHHPECALHQFGSFSTIQRHLPITGASILFFFFFENRCFHPFARSWDGTVTLVAFSQQKEPEHYHSRTATHPHCSPEWYHLMTAPHHACRHCIF